MGQVGDAQEGQCQKGTGDEDNPPAAGKQCLLRQGKLPQEMVTSGRPKPIKLNVDSATMAERMFMTTMNRMDEKKFGARWPNSSRKKPPPMHRLATMYPL